MNDITKESNELFSFNFEKNEWNQIQFKHQVADPVSAVQVEEFKMAKSSKVARVSSFNAPAITMSPEGYSLTKMRQKRMLYDGPVSPEKGRV